MIEGEASYYLDLPMPAVFRVGGATMAGTLPSPFNPPPIPAETVKSAPYKHWIMARWNCCEGSGQNKTIIDEWGPEEQK